MRIAESHFSSEVNLRDDARYQHIFPVYTYPLCHHSAVSDIHGELYRGCIYIRGHSVRTRARYCDSLISESISICLRQFLQW